MFMIKIFTERRLAIQVLRRFRHEFHGDKHGQIHSCNTVLKWVVSFQNTSSVCNYFVDSI